MYNTVGLERISYPLTRPDFLTGCPTWIVRISMTGDAMPRKVCPQCGEQFTPKYKSQRFCSRPCVAASRRKPPVYNTCEQCGERFETNRHDLARGYGRFCSRDCASESRKERIALECEQCGKEFERHNYYEDQRFCSYGCSAHSRMKFSNCEYCGEEFWLRKGTDRTYCSKDCYDADRHGFVDRLCETCGDTFSVRKTVIRQGGGLYCSRDCFYEAVRGPDCEYIGFTDSLKESIRKRDNRTCQLCGGRGDNHFRRLDVHHIDYNKHNPDPKNLITLCTVCHPKTNLNRDTWKRYFQYIMEHRFPD